MSLTTRLSLLTLFIAFMIAFCLPTQPPTSDHSYWSEVDHKPTTTLEQNVCDHNEVLTEDFTCVPNNFYQN